MNLFHLPLNPAWRFSIQRAVRGLAPRARRGTGAGPAAGPAGSTRLANFLACRLSKLWPNRAGWPSLREMSAPGESEMLTRCRKGDADAWNELFDWHYAATARFVHQISASFTLEDVEEICQETFLTVIKSIFTFQGHSQFQTWLFRIASNKAHDYIERQQAAKRGGGAGHYFPPSRVPRRSHSRPAESRPRPGSGADQRGKYGPPRACHGRNARALPRSH